MYIIACDVNTFAKSLWSAVNNLAFDDVCKGIYVTTRLRSFINCHINQGRTSNWKRDFLMHCVFFNNILIQILRFAYIPVTNSKGKNSFHRHFKFEVGDTCNVHHAQILSTCTCFCVLGIELVTFSPVIVYIFISVWCSETIPEGLRLINGHLFLQGFWTEWARLAFMSCTCSLSKFINFLLNFMFSKFVLFLNN